MERFEVAFSGQLVNGLELAQVRANLAKLFQADEKRLAILFSGKRVVIKSDLDKAGAEKYRTLMARAGALAEIISITPEVEEIELTALPGSPRFNAAPAPAPAPAPSALVPAATDPGAVVVRDEYMQAFAHVQAPHYVIAPVGADLLETKAAVAVVVPDVSGISLAPVGADMGEIPRDQQAPVLDLTHLRLSE